MILFTHSNLTSAYLSQCLCICLVTLARSVTWNHLDLDLHPSGLSLSVHHGATAEAVKHTAVRPGWRCEYSALLMPQADYFPTVITLSSPLCRSGLWGLMDTAMYNSLIISIQFDN